MDTLPIIIPFFGVMMLTVCGGGACLWRRINRVQEQLEEVRSQQPSAIPVALPASHDLASAVNAMQRPPVSSPPTAAVYPVATPPPPRMYPIPTQPPPWAVQSVPWLPPAYPYPSPPKNPQMQ